ncbi:excinuclease ABC subunit UvrC [bacterium SCSIO 12696]|nr:excinuclease ABC subunit UvrC [bacterium SCSIO 12696]
MTQGFDSAAFLKQLTQRPGIYQMLDASDKVLYVGKAKNLRKRVSSYFRNTGLAPKTRALVSRIAGVEVTVTETESEALILEQNLIKQYRPPYNILLRDDKSYPYIFLSDRDKFPRLGFYRGMKQRKGSYFGPFPSVQAVRETLSFLQKTFRVRQCQDSFFRNRSRPCLQYQIKRCTAPCVGLVNEEDYKRDVKHSRLFLEGTTGSLMKELEQQMEQAAEQLAFERAAELRDQIASLRKVQAQQVIESGSGNCDVVAAAMEGDHSCVHVLYIRRGRILGSRSYHPKVPLATSVTELLADFVPQLYLRGRGAADPPDEIVVNAELPDYKLIEQVLSEQTGRRMQLKHQVRGTRTRWLELASRTASENLSGRVAALASLNSRFESLGQLLELDDVPQRLECFDISHSSGEATVASCVVFDHSGPAKSDYRRFNIDGITPGDDYAAMAQALKRRYTRLQKGEGKLPDVLLIDGGKGQMHKAAEILAELGVVGVALVGIAKGVTRKPGLETLYLATEQGDRELTAEQSVLHLIQQVRDEAHRFAITGHKQRRDKKRRTSPLEGIPGVGPKRRRELLKFFGGLQQVQQAGVSDLARVPTISRKLAETIYSALHNE